jgi:sugar phosphate permease
MTSTGLLILASGLLLMAIAGVPEVARRARGMFHGWFLAGLGTLIAVLGDTPFYWGLSIWNPVLRNAFGWTAGQMSWAFAITQVEGGLFGPAEGLLVQKLGPRRAIFIGLTIFGLGFVLFSQVRELWQLYAIFFILSMGSGLAALLPMQTVVNNWFIRYKTRAMSLVMEGLAFGGIAVPLLLAWSIGGIDPSVSVRYGWSTTALFIGILVMALAFPISRLVHNRPEDLGLRPDGDSAVPAAASSVDAGLTQSEGEEQGYTLQEAIRSKTFWLISFANAISSIVLVVILVHLGLMLDDRGFSLQTISVVTAVYTATNAIFMLVGGYLGDRLPIRLVAFASTALQSLAVVVLVLTHDTEGVFLFAVLMGGGVGVRMPVTTAMRGVYFGRKAFAAISGISRVPSSITLFIAPLFAGFMRDATGTYDLSFLIIAAVSFLGSCLFLLVGEPQGLPASATRSRLAAD